MDLFKNKETYPFITDDGTDLCFVIFTAKLKILREVVQVGNDYICTKNIFLIPLLVHSLSVL
jgi:hypothetical protein